MINDNYTNHKFITLRISLINLTAYVTTLSEKLNYVSLTYMYLGHTN